ncbi:MAG: hypothetical protein PHF57_12200, partial [Methanoregula sp.]|nr:hypothetical protein [Methanoregula sp.]
PPYPQPASRKITGIFPEPSYTTSTIFPFKPNGQPRADTGNEAFGCTGFGEGKPRRAYFLVTSVMLLV